MSKNKIVTVVLWLMVYFSSIPKMYATSPTDVYAETHSLTEECDLNFKSFEVNVGETGNYYAEFWLLPAAYADGSYTKFYVYVNDKFIGNINPTKGNWQALRIYENETINLKRGMNIITIGVPSPEMPSVETIKLARKDADAVISSRAYDAYYTKASAGTSYNIPEQAQYSLYTNDATQSNNAPEVSLKHFSDVPLKYTFYSKFTFVEGQEVLIASSSLSEHDVDIVYVSSNNLQSADSILNSDSSSQANETTEYSFSDNGDQMNNSSIIVKKEKPLLLYKSATSEELQGLNWKGCSYKTSNSDYNTILKTIKIPKSGIYLIRLRHREPGMTGTASLIVNKMIYANVPISFSWIPCELPANGNEYGTMVKCSNPNVDDPMLFIHGADADRVVGHNDDASLRMRVIHELSTYDSHVLQQYNVRTSGISVCNYSSNTPESSCYIIAGIDESVFSPGPEWEFKPKCKENPHQSKYTNKTFGVNISHLLDHNGVVTITSESPINRVTVTDLSGTLIRSFQLTGTELSISKDLMNNGKSGVYIVSVETDNGIASKKLIFE
ncbi:MAG: T9SS type A sorting domain-containing protein [Muribaculaceae bacterium]|nr:T9SS type A sorting domain-containing protein [Muribaculaceae bacterium]